MKDFFGKFIGLGLMVTIIYSCFHMLPVWTVILFAVAGALYEILT